MRGEPQSLEEHAHQGATHVGRLPPVLVTAPPPSACTHCGGAMVVLDAHGAVLTCRGQQVGGGPLPVRVSWCVVCGVVHGARLRAATVIRLVPGGGR